MAIRAHCCEIWCLRKGFLRLANQLQSGHSRAHESLDSSSTNAVNFSSAGTTKRFPSSRCALTIHLVSPLEPIAETQPKLQPALLRLSVTLSQYFIATEVPLLFQKMAHSPCLQKLNLNPYSFANCSIFLLRFSSSSSQMRCN